MRIVYTHSHLNGLEWLLVHRRALWLELLRVLKNVDAGACKTKVSREKTMLGKRLFSPEKMNEEIGKRLAKLKWSEHRAGFYITHDYELLRATVGLPPEEQQRAIRERGLEPLYSFTQTDFVKGRVAVEVQFGKYAFLAYDIFVKHMMFFVSDHISVGVEVIPVKTLQAEMSSGPGYYEQALSYLAQQGKNVPAVPLVLIGVGP